MNAMEASLQETASRMATMSFDEKVMAACMYIWFAILLVSLFRGKSDHDNESAPQFFRVGMFIGLSTLAIASGWASSCLIATVNNFGDTSHNIILRSFGAVAGVPMAIAFALMAIAVNIATVNSSKLIKVSYNDFINKLKSI